MSTAAEAGDGYGDADEYCPCIDMECDEPGAEDLQVRMTQVSETTACVECGDAIAAGEEHEEAAGTFEDGYAVIRTCAGCADVRSAIVCGSWIYGELWQAIGEEGFLDAAAGPPRCVLKELGEAGSRRMRTMWMKKLVETTGGAAA